MSTTNIKYLPQTKFSIYQRTCRQTDHLRRENKNKTFIFQGMIKSQNDSQRIKKRTLKGRNKGFKKNNVTDKHAEDHVIHL